MWFPKDVTSGLRNAMTAVERAIQKKLAKNGGKVRGAGLTPKQYRAYRAASGLSTG